MKRDRYRDRKREDLISLETPKYSRNPSETQHECKAFPDGTSSRGYLELSKGASGRLSSKLRERISLLTATEHRDSFERRRCGGEAVARISPPFPFDNRAIKREISSSFSFFSPTKQFHEADPNQRISPFPLGKSERRTCPGKWHRHFSSPFREIDSCILDNGVRGCCKVALKKKKKNVKVSFPR